MIIQTISSGDGITFTQDGDDVSISSESGFTANTCDMPTMSNNSSDITNDIDFTEGFCYDLTTKAKISCSAMTKQLDAIFTEGTNQGGLNTGSKSVSTWYHCFAISKADGTSDFLFSTSLTAPTMPSGFINKRRIGSIKTDSSGNIVGFKQFKDTFYFDTIIQNVNVSTQSTTPVNYTISTPLGISTTAIINCSIGDADTFCRARVYSTWQTDTAVSVANANVQTAANGAISTYGSNQLFIKTDTSSQVRALSDSSLSIIFAIATVGYIDNRD